MNHGWNITPEYGFLLNPDPLITLRESGLDSEVIEQLESLAGNLAILIDTGRIQAVLDKLPLFDMSTLRDHSDGRIRERAFQIYSYLATAYLLSGDTKIIPANIAVPLVQLSEMVRRPPILSYATYTIGNWQRIDPDGAIEVENLRLLHKFINDADGAWFTLIHVEIEAKAAPAIIAIGDAQTAIQQDDMQALEAAFVRIQNSLKAMIATLKRMPEGCDPEIYYHRVRPYMFGFENVIYEGVAKFKGQPQSFHGETGAQSSVIPALVQAMGLQHEETGMTRYLTIMRDYMPVPHQEFLKNIVAHHIRDVVKTAANTGLKDAYNTTLRQILAFRRLHLRFASMYIAEKVENPTGTGGTPFMAWLQQLIDETERQYL